MESAARPVKYLFNEIFVLVPGALAVGAGRIAVQPQGPDIFVRLISGGDIVDRGLEVEGSIFPLPSCPGETSVDVPALFHLVVKLKPNREGSDPCREKGETFPDSKVPDPGPVIDFLSPAHDKLP
jgi:hypothetical protein